MIPIQARIIGAIVITAIVFGTGWKIASWKAAGKIGKMNTQIEVLTRERDQALLDIASVKLRLDNMREQRDEFDRRYQEAISQEPEIVVRYRDRWHEAPQVITTGDCKEGVAQLFQALHSLPERPR